MNHLMESVPDFSGYRGDNNEGLTCAETRCFYILPKTIFFLKMKHINISYTSGEIIMCFKLKKRQCLIIKRVMLILLALPALPLISYKPLDWLRTPYYIIPVSGIATYIVLINFPQIVKRVHARPLYYGDLEDARFVDPLIRKRFQFIFIIISQINLSLIMSVLIFYYYDRLHNTELSRMEIVGVIGGFVALLSKIENIIGKLTLTLMNFIKTSDRHKSVENVRRMRANSVEMIAEV